MQRFPNAHVTGEDWRTICRDTLDALGDIPETAGLGFVYIADALTAHAGDILDFLCDRTPVRHWVGSLAAGLCSMGRETYQTPALSVLVTDLTEEQFRVIPTMEESPSSFLKAEQGWREMNLSSIAVVHGDPRNQDLPHLIAQLSQGLEGGFLVGGLSSGNSEPFLQLANGVVENGLSGVLFAGGVPIATGLSQGCTLIGSKHEITDGGGNLVRTLDGRPALEVLMEEVGEELARDLRQLGGYVFTALPISGSDTGDYLVRNLIGFDPEQKMLAVGDRIREGMILQFATRDADSARADLVRMLRSVRSRLDGPPKGALYFSCLGRGRNLFGSDSEEMKLVQAELGDVPLAGFYANGEISHNRLYGYTGVLMVFQGMA